MAHTYVILSHSIGVGTDPQASFTGTVDGQQFTVTCWYSTYIQNAASAISAQNFVFGLLLAAWTAAQSPTLTNAPANGLTVTQ